MRDNFHIIFRILFSFYRGFLALNFYRLILACEIFSFFHNALLFFLAISHPVLHHARQGGTRSCVFLPLSTVSRLTIFAQSAPLCRASVATLLTFLRMQIQACLRRFELRPLFLMFITVHVSIVFFLFFFFLFSKTIHRQFFLFPIFFFVLFFTGRKIMKKADTI